ncbi:unnamed protein product [Gordionus sp. m RMFG-2023]
MKLKKFEGLLNEIELLKKPKLYLEQYNTSSHIVAQIINTIHTRFDNFDNKLIGDFGTGSGIFLIAASLIANCKCVGFDIDEDALQVATDVTMLDATLNIQRKPFDIIVMNPPFGTKNNKGLDMKFLSVACKLASRVYSLHKTSTREHIIKFAQQNGLKIKILSQIQFDIPSSYEFHRQDSVDIEVDFIRVWNRNQ